MHNMLSYFKDTYKFSDTATITAAKRDDRGCFITLDHTIFYPQGGGQPSDEGSLVVDGQQIPIVTVKMVDNEVRHYTDQDYAGMVGHIAQCQINQAKRVLHAKLHTSGHLISNVIEEAFPSLKGVKGHHFPGECYVEFKDKRGDISEIDINMLNQKLALIISEAQSLEAIFITSEQLKEMCPDLSYTIPESKSIRIARIGRFQYQPCGGTHVSNTSELLGLKITKFKVKNSVLKISYEIQ